MNLLDLMVKVGVDDQASAKIANLSSSIGSKLSSAAKIGSAAMAATTAAATATAAAFDAMVVSVANYGDNIDKMSQKMGMSTTAYQEWDSVMRHSGTSMESMKASMKTLANAAETGNEAFAKIGLTQEQIASMSQEELFGATIEGLQGVEDTTQRTYLAGQLMGRGATELGALLNKSAEETQAMKDRVHELGGVMSEDAVQSSARFKDSLQDLETAVTGLKNRAFGQLIPSVTTVMDGLQEIFIGNVDKGLELVETGVNEAVKTISDNLPRFLEVAGNIIGALAKGIITNLPTIVKAMLEGIVELINTIADNTDEFVDGAIEIIVAIAEAIIESAPKLLEALARLLASLVNSIVNHIPDFLAAAGKLLQAIMTTLASAFKSILEMLGSILTNAVNAVRNGMSSAAQAIGTVLNNIKTAWNNAWSNFLSFLGGVWNGIVSTVRNAISGVWNAIVSALNGIANSWGSAWNNVQRFFSTIWNNMGSIVANGVNTVVRFVASIPSRIMSLFTNAGSWLWNAGQAIIDGLVGGIRSAIGWLQNTLSSITNMIPSWKGPEDVDRDLLKESGQLIMGGLIKGIESKADALKATLGDVTKSVSGWDYGTVGVDAGNYTASARGGAVSAVSGPLVAIQIDSMNVRDDNDIDLIAEQLAQKVKREIGGGLWNASYSAA